MFSVALIGVLMLSLLAACGSDDDDGDDSGSNGDTPTATTSSGGDATEPATETETESDDGTATGGNLGNPLAIGACLQEGMTPEVVADLRAGNTESSEAVYQECLGDALPEPMASQLDPIIEQAGTCGSDAAAELSDEDMTAIEEGDQEKIQQLTNDTLECLSEELGVPLQ